MTTKKLIEKIVEKENGILRLKPAWVARDFLPSGNRLGLKEGENYIKERGWIGERWLASTIKADNFKGSANEGLSFINFSNQDLTLKESIELAGDIIMGKDYYKNHKTLGRLAKIYDFVDRLPFHYHQMKRDAKLVGKNSKEEAYYFPEGFEFGAHPETFFGVHPYITEQKKYDVLLPYLIDWNSDLILKYSRAFLNVKDEGFHLPSGVLHAPGTTVTIELQEESDVFAMTQALVAGKIISKELLFKDIRKQDRKKYGEKIILDQINWETSGDPFFYENRHLIPKLIYETKQEDGEEYWIYYNTTKFSGKKLVIKPKKTYKSIDNGVYNIFVLKGKGNFDGKYIEAGNFYYDELLITYEKAIRPLFIKNEGNEPLIIIKFFGPEINNNIPYIEIK